MNDRVSKQIKDAYRQMAERAHYRPAAPSDGMGNVTVAAEALNLEAEAEAYAQGWQQTEETHAFWVGCCNYPTRPATIYAVEAARSMCGCGDDVALRLLRMAVTELELQA